VGWDGILLGENILVNDLQGCFKLSMIIHQDNSDGLPGWSLETLRVHLQVLPVEQIQEASLFVFLNQ
jgi:hypothetical protein